MSRVAIACAVTVAILAMAAIAWPGLPPMAEKKIGQRLAAAEVERRAAEEEKKREARFEAPITPCGHFGRGSGPQVCLQRVSPETGPFGRPIDLRLRWRNLDPGQRIRVRVTSAAPAGSRYRYSGPSGAITERLFGATPNGDELVRWDGKSIFCAPADAPMMCDAGEVGRYRLEALLFIGDDPFWPSWPSPKPDPARILVRSEDPQIELTGPPRPLMRSRQSSNLLLSQTLKAAFPPELATHVPSSWDLLEEERPFRPTLFSYCAELPLGPPLDGQLRLCFPKSVRDEYGVALRPGDVTVHGRPVVAAGVLHPQDAKRIAERAAISAFRGQYDFDHYPRDDELTRFGPRPENEDRWRNRDERDAAQNAWESRIVYLQQQQTIAWFIGDGSWLVSVDQVARDLGQQLRSDFLVYYYRIGTDKRPCLIALWNRTKQTGGPPRTEQAHALPCLS